MRHTLFVVLGENIEPMVLGIRGYVDNAKMGVGAYFRILHYKEKDEIGIFEQCQAGSLSEVCRIDKDGREALLQSFFEKCQRQQVTADNPGDSPVRALHVCFVLPTQESRSLAQLQEFLKVIDKVRAKEKLKFQVDLFLFASDMAFLFEDISEASLAKKKDEFRKTSESVIHQLVEIKKSKDDFSIILMQNSNAKGASLNLTAHSLARIMGEYALLAVCKYDTLFPPAAVPVDRPIYALGLSVLEFREDKATKEIVRQACLEILNRENVSQNKVDVNKIISDIVKKVLPPHLQMFSHIFEKSVMPLLEQKKSQEQIMAAVTPEINEKLESLKTKCLSFFDDDKYSLPEKEAALSKLLGNDDPIFEGTPFDRNPPVFEDCFTDAIDFFVKANAKLKQDDDFEEYALLPTAEDVESFGALRGIIKENEETIRQESSYIRKKTIELDATNSLLTKENGEEQNDDSYEVNLDKDSGITRSVMISQNIEEKKQSIEAARNSRNTLDTLSEYIVQTLGDSKVRDKVCEGLQKKLEKDRLNLENEKEQKEQDRLSVLREIDAKRRLLIGRFALSWAGYAFAMTMACIINGSVDILTSKFSLITYAVLFISILAFSFMLHKIKREREDADEYYRGALGRMAKQIDDLLKEKEVVKLRGHIAGMFIDRRNILSAELEKKNIDIRDMVNRLRDWRATLLSQVMDGGGVGQFISLVIKTGLEKFFKKQKGVVTAGVFLHRILRDGVFAEDDGFAKLLDMLTQGVKSKLQSQFGSFSAYQFMEKKADYDYLGHDDVDVKHVLSQMDELSEVFLIKRDLAESDARDYAKKILFISKPQDENGEYCRDCFLERPNVENYEFPNKATLLRLEALSENEIAMMEG